MSEAKCRADECGHTHAARGGRDRYGRWCTLLADAPEPRTIPDPEVPCRDAQPHEVCRAARAFATLATAHDWTVRVTYARGPRTHATHGTVLRFVDSTAVRARRGADRVAGVWVDRRFDTGLVWDAGSGIVEVGAAALADRVKRADAGRVAA